jgi:hypothetical protein
LGGNVNPYFLGGWSAMQIWKDSKYNFQEKQGRGGGVRQSGKFPDYTGFFLLKASLRHVGNLLDLNHDLSRPC